MKDTGPAEIRDALQEGVDTEGGYTIPDFFENKLITAMNEKNVMRIFKK